MLHIDYNTSRNRHIDASYTPDGVVDLMKSEVVIEAVAHYATNLKVIASGEYLELIKRLFMYIPMTTNKSVTWEGEIAKFILVNLMTYANS